MFFGNSIISNPATTFTAERWRQFWDFWKAQPQQLDGIEQLRLAIIAADPEILTETAAWRQCFSAAAVASFGNPLAVAWENQNDNASGTGYRECFSSSCAMLARYWGKVANDDEYNAIRAQYGDTTSAQVQLTTLHSLGLTAYLATNGDRSALEAEINGGRPVAVGWLHQGPVEAPSGGGHWSVLIGFSDSHSIHHDPNGEADLLSGGYTANQNGASQQYSWKNWLPRWEVEGHGTGWLLSCHI